jgi:hypothetical protein
VLARIEARLDRLEASTGAATGTGDAAPADAEATATTSRMTT